MGLRRREILDDIENAGISVARLFGVYGKERDAVISRAKIVLNLHYYKAPIFEIFRVSHLLANKKCVVSENGNQDKELEIFADHAIAHVPKHRLIETLKELLADKKKREFLKEKGFEEFSKINLSTNIEKALSESNRNDFYSPGAVA